MAQTTIKVDPTLKAKLAEAKEGLPPLNPNAVKGQDSPTVPFTQKDIVGMAATGLKSLLRINGSVIYSQYECTGKQDIEWTDKVSGKKREATLPTWAPKAGAEEFVFEYDDNL